MADKIKKFFARKKAETKFKLAGPGRNLTQQSTSSGSKSKPDKDAYIPPQRKELSGEARAAAEAAMARTQKRDVKEFNTSLAAIQAQVKKELEAEKQKSQEVTKQIETAKSKENEHQNFAVQGVYFRCPLVSEEILPKKDWKIKIKEFLYEQLEDEKGLTACLIILNCNVKDKAEQCVEILSKYLENIINNPDDEKYRKIRMSNRVFCDKVRYIEGVTEFLSSAGFIEQTIDDESFLVWFGEDVTQLQCLLDALHCSEIIPLELDRNIQVLSSSQARTTVLPPDFYRISPEEMKREQELRASAIESAQILMTKAMRDKEEMRMINRYRFSLVRVRFPDGVYLQGTFNVYEKLSAVHEFVESCLKDEAAEFSLTEPTGHKFTQETMDKTLFDLRLIPNVILNFSYDSANSTNGFIKEDLMMLIQSI